MRPEGVDSGRCDVAIKSNSKNWLKSAINSLAAFRADEKWYLESSDLVQQAQREQADRYEGDAWDSLIIAWATARLAGGCDSVSVAEALEMGLNKKRGPRPTR